MPEGRAKDKNNIFWKIPQLQMFAFIKSARPFKNGLSMMPVKIKCTGLTLAMSTPF